MKLTWWQAALVVTRFLWREILLFLVMALIVGWFLVNHVTIHF